MKQIHRINGKVVKPPFNYEEISFELVFDEDSQERGVSVTRFEWVEGENDTLLSIQQGGLTGSTGILEGVPHTIEVVENGVKALMFDGYIDLKGADWGKDVVSADSVPRNQLDWINEIADGFTVEVVYENGNLTDDDIVFVPYVISNVPNYTEAFLVILTMTFVILELKRLITDIINKITESAGYLSSVSGVINLIFKIIWGILMLVTVIELILTMVDLLIQKVKYKPSMSLNRQLEACCEYLGLQYKSSFLQTTEWNKCHIIPESFSNPSTQSDSKIKGYFKGDTTEQNGYFRGTFGDLLRAVKEIFNARIVVNSDTLEIVPRLRTANSSSFVLPPQFKPKFEYRLNADELISNYLIAFRYDSSDANTIDEWLGNNVQIQLKPKNIKDKKLRLISGFKQVQIPFARGIKKTELTDVEKIVDDLLEALTPVIGAVISIANGAISVLNAIFDVINKITKALSTIGIKINLNLPKYDPLEDPNLGELLDNRIGMLRLEKDFFTVPKLVMLDVDDTDDSKTKLAAENETHIKAKYLYDNFHLTNSFTPNKNSAQRYIYKYENVEMNLADFLKVQSDGVVKLPDQTVGEVISCQWNPSNRLANFDIRVRKLWTNNLTERILEPTGR